jgi:hypothetical protein
MLWVKPRGDEMLMDTRRFEGLAAMEAAADLEVDEHSLIRVAGDLHT